MTMTDEQKSNARKIHQLLAQQSSLAPITSGRLPDWYGKLITDLLLVRGNEEIEYLTGLYFTNTARVVAFTPSLLIQAEVSNADADRSQIDVTAFSRSTIMSIQVDAAAVAFPTEGFSSWPGDLKLTITYLQKVVLVPLDHLTNGDQTGPVQSLLASLKLDLTAAQSRG